MAVWLLLLLAVAQAGAAAQWIYSDETDAPEAVNLIQPQHFSFSNDTFTGYRIEENKEKSLDTLQKEYDNNKIVPRDRTKKKQAAVAKQREQKKIGTGSGAVDGDGKSLTRRQKKLHLSGGREKPKPQIVTVKRVAVQNATVPEESPVPEGAPVPEVRPLSTLFNDESRLNESASRANVSGMWHHGIHSRFAASSESSEMLRRDRLSTKDEDGRVSGAAPEAEVGMSAAAAAESAEEERVIEKAREANAVQQATQIRMRGNGKLSSASTMHDDKQREEWAMGSFPETEDDKQHLSSMNAMKEAANSLELNAEMNA